MIKCKYININYQVNIYIKIYSENKHIPLKSSLLKNNYVKHISVNIKICTHTIIMFMIFLSEAYVSLLTFSTCQDTTMHVVISCIPV